MRKDLDPSTLRVCYLNITRGDFSRSGVHIHALIQQGVQIASCIDNSPGIRKFWEIYKKHRALYGGYDVIIVGYPAYILVPFARLISRKPILFDAGWSLYEGTVVARGLYAREPLKRLYYWAIDWFACRSAHLVLVESEHQVAYYQGLLRVSVAKVRRLFTGVNETQFPLNPAPKKKEVFTVLFRGYANPEAGLAHIVSVARALEGEGIHFLVISPNAWLKDLPKNVEYREGFFSCAELCEWMQSCHASIGHVSTNERLERTIPHKAFEAMLFRLPFVTADSAAIREILDEESSVLVRPGDEEDIAAHLRRLRDDGGLRDRIAEAACSIYQKRCSNAVLGGELVEHIRSVLD